LINAHESVLSALALNSDGTRLATSSDRGTLIRLFTTQSGALLQELRRGSDRAEIFSLAFSPTTEWLACSSDKGTIHIFSLSGEKTKGRAKKTTEEGPQLTDGKTPSTAPIVATEPSSQPGADASAKKASVSTTDGKAPTTSAPGATPEESKTPADDASRKNPTSTLSWASNFLPWVGSEWSFAQYKVPDNSQTIVAFGEEKNSIIVVSADGVFYKAHFDPDKPGSQCVQQMYTKFVKDAAEEQPQTTSTDAV